MTAGDQKGFVETVRKALGAGPSRSASSALFETEPSAASRRLLERIRSRGPEEGRRLFTGLRKPAASLHVDLHIAQDPSAAAALIAGIFQDRKPEWGEHKRVAAWQHPLVSRLKLEAALGIPVCYSQPDPSLPPEEGRRRLRRQIGDSFIGVTAADFCLADTATLVLFSGPGRARSVSLLPSIHVALVESGRLLANLAELYALLRWDRTPDQGPEAIFSSMVMVSGPSKTADIEATLVHGAHGPRELHLIVLDDGKTLDSGSKI